MFLQWTRAKIEINYSYAMKENKNNRGHCEEASTMATFKENVSANSTWQSNRKVSENVNPLSRKLMGTKTAPFRQTEFLLKVCLIGYFQRLSVSFFDVSQALVENFFIPNCHVRHFLTFYPKHCWSFFD